MANHDATTRRPEQFRIDLKEKHVKIEEILRFNEMLYQQISSKKEERLFFGGDHKKHYLLVPLSKVEGSEFLEYQVDFRIIEAMARETNWVSI